MIRVHEGEFQAQIGYTKINADVKVRRMWLSESSSEISSPSQVRSGPVLQCILLAVAALVARFLRRA